MVNLDLLSKNAAPLQSVEETVDTVMTRLGRLCLQKLADSGSLMALELMSEQQPCETLADESDRYIHQFECHLFKNVRSLVSLLSFHWRYRVVEDQLLTRLAERARRDLNTITDTPPVATRLALEIEALLAISPARGATGDALAQRYDQRLKASQERCQELLSKANIEWNDLVNADKPLPAAELIAWATHLMQATAMIQKAILRLEKQFGDDAHDRPQSGTAAFNRRSEKFKQRPTHRRMPPAMTGQRPNLQLHETEATEQLIEQNFHAFAVIMDQSLMRISNHLEGWSQNEIHRTANAKPRRLDVENSLYTEGIRRTLHHLGASVEDASLCADKLLHYCRESDVAASELIDDEIWSLYPKINREILKQARLRVRLTDHQFPLSVAHREWINQLSERALTGRT